MSRMSRRGGGGTPSEKSGLSWFALPRVRMMAGTVIATLAVASISFVGAEGASAASAPRAQSVGRFLDGAAGSNPIQQLADVQDARATAPGTQSVQNPLNVTLLNALEVPLTGALQLPSIAGIHLGAVNQVAVAHTNGYAYGASGAVSNSGGVSVGGDNNAYPANATIDLSDQNLTGSTIPVPGAGSLPGLISVKASIGAVSALASTPAGFGAPGSTDYNIAGLRLTLGSPALGGLLSGVDTGLGSASALLQPVINALKTALPQSCTLTSGSLGSTISLAGGAVVVDVAHASVTVDVAALLHTLGLDLNNLPANTDLIKYVVDRLPTVLSTGLANVINGLIHPLSTALTSCLTALNPQASQLGTLFSALESGVTTLTDNLGKLVSTVTDGLAPLTDGLKKVIAIGVNVQPNGPKGTYASPLKATPNQATAVVPGQTIVRAIEVDLLGGQVASLALANAAAGPSTGAAVASTSVSRPNAPNAPNNAIPTGIPAGSASGPGVPTLPLVLVTVGLVLAAGGAVVWKLRYAHLH